jgi:hypothetical protein
MRGLAVDPSHPTLLPSEEGEKEPAAANGEDWILHTLE